MAAVGSWRHLLLPLVVLDNDSVEGEGVTFFVGDPEPDIFIHSVSDLKSKHFQEGITQPLMMNCFNVSLEVDILTKCLFTVGALVGLQPLMNCLNVGFKGIFSSKILFTVGALVRLQPFMNCFDVQLKVVF